MKPNLTSPSADPSSLAKEPLPQDATILSLTEIFKVLADSTRLKIVFALLDRELCVSELCRMLSFSQSAVSHQLRVLRDSHLVKFRKHGKSVFYSIDDDHVSAILRLALEHVRHRSIF